MIWMSPVPFPIGMTIPSGSRSGNKNWVVFLLILPIWIRTFSCSRTEIGIELWSNRWLTRNKWIFVARPSKATWDRREKKDSLIVLLTPSDNANTSSMTIVKCSNWCLGLSNNISCLCWIILRLALRFSLISETKSDLDLFFWGWIIAILFSLAQREGVSNFGSIIISSEICFR